MKFFITGMFSAILFCGNVYGEPYISIKKIDPDSTFPVIQLEVSVMDRWGQSPADINEENIFLYEDGFRMVNRLKVEKIKDNNGILYLVFSIDSSRSISREFLSSIKKAAVKIVNSAGVDDKIAVFRFNDEVIPLQSFTEEKKVISDNIMGIERHGNRTLLFNSIYDSLEILEKIKGKRKAVIVFTDGKDEGSSVNESDIISLSKSAGLPVYFICLKTSRNIKTMARISKLTGGRLVYSGDNSSVADMYSTVSSYIKNRYHIKYMTAVKKDGMEHRVEVKLKYGRLRDSDSAVFKTGKAFLDISLKERPVLVLITIIVMLIILIIIILTYFIKKEKNKLSELSGPESPLPKISPVLKEQHEEDDRYEEDSVLLSDDPEFSYTDAWLVEKAGPETGKKYPIYFNEIILGRSDEASISINDDAVSMKHAKIKAAKNKFYLYDLVSENGTFLNGNKLLRPKPLYDWDIIKIGRTELIFRGSKTAG